MHGPYATDPCSYRGAERLASQIKNYWRERGHEIEVWTEKYLESVYMVKSNLRRGNPVRRAIAPPPHSPWDFTQAFKHPQRR